MPCRARCRAGPVTACTDAMLMIRPSPLPIMWRATACPTLKTVETLVRINRSNASASNSSSRARCCMPALLTRMSTGPDRASWPSTAARTAAWSVASKASALTAAPVSASRACAAASFASSRPLSTMRAPALASPSASAWPMPCDEPVTSAVLPVRSNSSVPAANGRGPLSLSSSRGHELAGSVIRGASTNGRSCRNAHACPVEAAWIPTCTGIQ